MSYSSTPDFGFGVVMYVFNYRSEFLLESETAGITFIFAFVDFAHLVFVNFKCWHVISVDDICSRTLGILQRVKARSEFFFWGEWPSKTIQSNFPCPPKFIFNFNELFIGVSPIQVPLIIIVTINVLCVEIDHYFLSLLICQVF